MFGTETASPYPVSVVTAVIPSVDSDPAKTLSVEVFYNEDVVSPSSREFIHLNATIPHPSSEGDDFPEHEHSVFGFSLTPDDAIKTANQLRLYAEKARKVSPERIADLQALADAAAEEAAEADAALVAFFQKALGITEDDGTGPSPILSRTDPVALAQKAGVEAGDNPPVL